MFVVSQLSNIWNKPIIFTLKDGNGVNFLWEVVLVITTILSNYTEHKVLMDDECIEYSLLKSDHIYGIDLSVLTSIKTLLVRIKGKYVLIEATIDILITICT